MKALEWHTFLVEQREKHGKMLFSFAELANVAGTSRNSLKVQLHRLSRQGVIRQYARGWYGLPTGVSVEALVRAVDTGAYITGAYALYRHGVITQTQHEITCFTNRRSAASRVRQTPLGRLVLMCVGSGVYAPPHEGVLAPPEQALLDFVFICRRRGVAPSAIVTFTGHGLLDTAVLDCISPRYPSTVRADVAEVVVDEGLGG